MRILVTPRSLTRSPDHPALQFLRAAGAEIVLGPAGRFPTEAELLGLLPGVVGWVAGVEPIGERVLTAAIDLRVISRNGTGVDAIDLPAAAARGIQILRADGANARGVAELTLGLMFALARQIPWHDSGLKQAVWGREPGFELRGKTLALCGLGQVGRRVAEGALAIGMHVIFFDPIGHGESGADSGLECVSFPELLSRADLLSLHCPPLPEGRPLIDAPTLQLLNRGTCLINTARAVLIDESAVLAALDSGHLAGYATDVFPTEPPTDWTLARHHRVIATPHLGANTHESVERASRTAVDHLLAALRQS
jgi:D-3-phosphoglycerate dehydrogenase / 2-oxoglutarate reductase